VVSFEVHLFARGLRVTVDSAEHAYGWLDAHAQPEERFALTATTAQGGAVAIESGSYAKPSPRQAGC
jgi:hypothetical protein